MKKIVYYILILICIPLVHIHAQTEQIRSGTSNGAGWISGGPYATFGVAGQSGVATEVGGGNYTGSVGFVFLPVFPVVNELPIAYGTPAELFYEIGSVYALQGFDPEGEALIYELVTQPTLGTVYNPDPTLENEVAFAPNLGLQPNTVYHDSFEFKVIEAVNGQESAPAVIEFSFILADQAQEIVSFTKEGADFTLKWFDPFINDSYNIKMDYYDLTDPTQPQFVNVTTVDADSQTFTVGNSNTIDYTISVSDVEHPYLLNGNLVFITVELTAPGGFSDFASYVLDNSDPSAVNVLASSDGLFFAFGSTQSVPENNEVTIQMSGVELGDFDLSQAFLRLTGSPELGTLTQPILVNSTDNILTWEAVYTSTQDIGGLEEIPFEVVHPDRDITESANVTLTIVDSNDPPTLGEIFNQQMLEDEVLEIELAFSDPDNDVEFTAVANNDADKVDLSIDGNMLTITPDAEFSGTISISGVLSELATDELLSVSETFNLEIIAQNDSPVLQAVNNQTSNEDVAVEVALSASDVDGDVLLFDYIASVDDPSIAELELIGDQLIVNPIANASGLVTVTVAADDKSGSSNSESSPVVFTVDFTPVNDQPEVIQNLEDQVLVENFPGYDLDLAAYFSDVETASADLTYSTIGNTDVSFAFLGSVATITTTPDYFGTETVTIIASDGSLQNSFTVDFIVNELSADIVVNQAISDVNLEEDFDTFSIDISGVFIDNNDANAVFTYQLSGSNFVITSIDNVNQTATISSAQDVSENETLLLVGSTAGLSGFTEFDLIISSVNDAPTLGEIDNESVFEDGALSNLLIETSDVDNAQNELVVTATSDNQTLLNDSDLSVSFDNGFYYLDASPGADLSGNATITVTVSDGSDQQQTSFTLNVLSVNDSPTQVVSTLNAGTEDIAYSVDLATLYQDIDNDVLSFEIPNLPAWLIQSGSSLSGTPLNGDTGSIDLQVVADDGNGGSIQSNYTLTIAGVNDAPEFASIASQTINEDNTLSEFLIDVEDVDNSFGELIFSAVSSDESIIPNTGITVSSVGGFLTVTATPLDNQNGTVDITVSANDGSLTGDGILTIVIDPVNDQPVVVTTTVPAATEDESFSQSVVGYFTDVDVNDILTIALTDNPSWLSISDGVLTGTPTNDDVGSIDITLTASDGNGGSVSDSYTLVVNNVNDAPIVANAAANVSSPQNTTYSYTIQESVFSDIDADDQLTFSVEGFPDWLTLNGTTLEGTPGYDDIGTHIITIKATDQDGLSVTETFDLVVEFVVYDVAFTASTSGACVGSLATVEASGAFDYNWYDSDGNLLQSDGSSFDISATEGGQVIIEAKDDQDRVNPERQTIDLIVNASPDVPTVTEGDMLSVPDEAGLTYQWYLDDVAIPGAAATEPTITPEDSGEYYVVVSNSSGCTAQSLRVTITLVTGLGFNDITIDMYPVPTKNILTITSESDLSKFRFSITDVNGKYMSIRSTRHNNQITFDTKELSSGVYLMRMNTEDKVLVRRFMKE